MSLPSLKRRFKEILAIGLVKSNLGYLEEMDMDKFVSQEYISNVVSAMEKRNLIEAIIIAGRYNLFILKIEEGKFVTCVASPEKPFGYCRKILHEIAREMH